jgi:fatty acid desaturase
MTDERPPADHVSPGSNGIPIEENIKSRSTWLRLLYMAVFYVLAMLTGAVLSVVVVLAFFWVLFTGEKNEQLQQAGQAGGAYLNELVRYLTFNTEDRPFPFGNQFPSVDG